MQEQMIKASKRADMNSTLWLPVTASSNRPTMPMIKVAEISKLMAKKINGRIVNKDWESHRHIKRLVMAVKVWQGEQGEQQQRQDDLSRVEGGCRNRGWVVDMVTMYRTLAEGY